MPLPPGQPTKFTKENRELLLKYLAEGQTRKIACSLVCIHYDTFRLWLNLGRNKPDKHPEHSAFLHKVLCAEAEAKRLCVRRIRKASRETWQAAAWLLERTDEDFSSHGNELKRLRKEVAEMGKVLHELLGSQEENGTTPPKSKKKSRSDPGTTEEPND